MFCEGESPSNFVAPLLTLLARGVAGDVLLLGVSDVDLMQVQTKTIIRTQKTTKGHWLVSCCNANCKIQPKHRNADKQSSISSKDGSFLLKFSIPSIIIGH